MFTEILNPYNSIYNFYSTLRVDCIGTEPLRTQVEFSAHLLKNLCQAALQRGGLLTDQITLIMVDNLKFCYIPF